MSHLVTWRPSVAVGLAKACQTLLVCFFLVHYPALIGTKLSCSMSASYFMAYVTVPLIIHAATTSVIPATPTTAAAHCCGRQWLVFSHQSHLDNMLRRLALYVDSAHHLVAFLQAVAQAAPQMELESRQQLWSSLYMLHLHVLATLTPVLEV